MLNIICIQFICFYIPPCILAEGFKGKGEPKQVIFSDGIRPGGDLTELDGSSEPFIPSKKPVRNQKKVVLGM